MASKEKLRSIADIARIAGVSKSTVSRALNDSPLAGEETKQRIRDIAEAHDFQRSAMARNLSLRASHSIAFVTHAYASGSCTVTDPFSLEIMGEIADGLHELGYDLLIAHVDPHDRDWPSLLDSCRVDGFILMTSAKKRSQIDLLLRKGAPFVAWGANRGAYCTVCGDDFRGGRIATERMIATNRSRIAFIGGPQYEGEVKERMRGYEAALKAAGRDVSQDLIGYGDYSEASGARVMQELLKRDPRIDGVFCNSDLMAIAAMRALEAAGRKVPADVAVIGYDNLTLASYVTPALTTVSQNIQMAGKLLARDLVAFLKQGVITSTTVPVELILRASA